MPINKTWIQTCVAAAVLTLAQPILADNHAKSDSFKTVKVTDQISMLQGKGGNLGLLSGKQGLLLIDSEYKKLSAVLKQELKNYGGTDALTYIINTHWHGDHTQGNLALGQYAPIVAHDNVRARLLTRQEIKLFKMIVEPYPEIALPSITYDKTMTLHINAEEVEIKHYANGHTDGDSVVFFKKANVVHTGDHFFSGMFPFVDVDTGGNVLNMATNIKAILKRIDNKTKIIPGHGPLSNKADMQAFHDMLIGTSAEVKAMRDKGLSLEQIKKKGLSNQWQPWTKGIFPADFWIGIVHSSLEKNKQ